MQSVRKIQGNDVMLITIINTIYYNETMTLNASISEGVT